RKPKKSSWSVVPGDAESDGITAAKTQRRDARPGVAILHGVQQRREHARAAGTDRVSESDRAAVDVDALPVPAQRLPVGKRLRCERFVGLDQIVVTDAAIALFHQV